MKDSNIANFNASKESKVFLEYCLFIEWKIDLSEKSKERSSV